MYKHLISQFTQPSILVIGDLMLDIYLKGASTRLTPEAPVPVVDILSDSAVLGGGANTAINLRYLGANVTFCSIAGQDADGDKAVALLKEAGITSLVLQHSGRNTLVKTRVLAGNQMLVRYDRGSEADISPALEALFIDLLVEQYALHDAIVIADYKKGLITAGVISVLEILSRKEPKFIAIDSKRLDFFRGISPSLVKPNYQEAIQLLGLQTQYSSRTQQVEKIGQEVSFRTGARIVALTLDEDGAVIFEGGQLTYRCCPHMVTPLQVAGAGDVYIGAFTLACLAGAEISVAAELAATAAGVAISKSTTAFCTNQELNAYLSINEKYITDLQQLEHLSTMYKAQQKKIVFTNGCFDILHSGHVNYLNRARELGHVLIVGINTDDSIKRIKGNDRPINQLNDRIEVLAGLGAVSHIIPFGAEGNDTPAQLIKLIAPHIFAKGGDYTEDSLPEAALVRELGGEIVLLQLLPDRSTTLILDRIHTTHMIKSA
jgi:D-beta-D-heptose 7-phosphate kinase/D-beta-D-heptose 1-phosphate adenosyltransferase